MAELSKSDQVAKLTATAEKLDVSSQHKKLRALHRRVSRAKKKIEKLESEDKDKNAAAIEEKKKAVTTLREEIQKTLASSPREQRVQLKRVQRRATVLTPLPLEEREKRLQKQSDIIGKILSDLTKNTKKSQADARVHSLRKKVKSLNKRLKKVKRLLEKRKKSAPAAPAAPAEAAPAPEAPKA